MPLWVRRMRRTGKAARPHPGPRVSAQCARSPGSRSRRIISQTGSLGTGAARLVRIRLIHGPLVKLPCIRRLVGDEVERVTIRQ
jgi:hypothetical protein